MRRKHSKLSSGLEFFTWEPPGCKQKYLKNKQKNQQKPKQARDLRGERQFEAEPLLKIMLPRNPEETGKYKVRVWMDVQVLQNFSHSGQERPLGSPSPTFEQI